MTRYAQTTSVPSDRSRAELERLLERYGANEFGYAWKGEAAVIVFTAHGKRVQFTLPLPRKDEDRFVRTGARNNLRSPADAARLWEQETRSLWRALLLVVKAKLEAVESGITEFEDEFLAHFVLPDGRTVGTFLKPQLEQAYASREMPPMLCAPKGR